MEPINSPLQNPHLVVLRQILCRFFVFLRKIHDFIVSLQPNSMVMLIKIYPDNPSQRHLKTITECLEHDGIIVFPTDTIYAIGGSVKSAKALEKIAQIKGIKKEKAQFSFIFNDLSMLSEFTKPISNDVFKLMRRNFPGPFTFILEANNNIPKIFQSRKKTIGIRIPDNPITRLLVKELGCPLMSTSIACEDEILGFPTDPEEIHDIYRDRVDIVVDGGFGGNEESTIVDCTDDEIMITRQAKGVLMWS